MATHPAFELLREEDIPEIHSLARFCRHKKTGAEVLSLSNDDENKVFGVTFKTPPEDSTGVAHILEHSVLCGSRKYPVKKPFVEMLKGSLHTFLNAMTFSDKTAYPVASQNLKDFYNLVDVYLDAVYFPLITEDTFQQEGWHYEADGKDGPLVYKGVVFNEMKGVYSSPDAVLGDHSFHSLFPDTTYGVNSGGDPKAIPELTYQYFKNFHEKFYHPSNTRAFFYGDDDPAERLEILDAYFREFDRKQIDAPIELQPRFNAPRRVEATYAGTPEEGKKTGMMTLNWMLDEVTDRADILALGIMNHVLMGTAGAPLRKALTDSGIGEGITGGGLSNGIRQPTFSAGLKGIDDDAADSVAMLIEDTLRAQVRDGVNKDAIEAAVNTFEFALRENNTGSLPRGISIMLRSMGNWLYDRDPVAPLAFEAPLAEVKARLAEGGLIEGLIQKHLLDNQHRTLVMLTADAAQSERDASEERELLAKVRDDLDPAALDDVVAQTARLKALQEAADPPEQLAKIPTLTLEDLPRQNKVTPFEEGTLEGARSFFHEQPTSGIIYLDLGFDLHALSGRLLPYLSIFSRALTQTGNSKEDFVSLSRRIGRDTGGVGISRMVATTADGKDTAAWLFVRGKATPDKGDALLSIITDVLTDARLDNRERIRQMVLEEKAGFEGRLSGAGNAFVTSRLRAGLNEADWISEQTGGVSYLFFLRDLAQRIDTDWPAVQAALEEMRAQLINRTRMVVNVTSERPQYEAFRQPLIDFLKGLPHAGQGGWDGWGFAPATISEGLTFPGKVNYVGKGADLFALGFRPSAAVSVALKHLNTTYIWDKVRVQGGAYGGGASYDPFSGAFSFSSYRDPNLLKTLDAYDGAAEYLAEDISDTELVRSIIGVIGNYDAYQLPDAKGFSSMARRLVGDTDEARQRRREEVLSATKADFTALGDALRAVAMHGRVVVLGSEAAIKAANDERGVVKDLTRVM